MSHFDEVGERYLKGYPMKIILRIIILIILLVGSVPAYFSLCPEDRREVIEITQDTYAELAETDNMYLNLPLGASVSGINVDQRLGDAYIDVCITVSDDNMNEFKEWLGERGNQYSQKQNHIYISYFVSDHHFVYSI